MSPFLDCFLYDRDDSRRRKKGVIMGQKTNWNHLNFEQRKIIANGLAKHNSCVEIADLLEVDPTTVSKEIKRNRLVYKKGKINPNSTCRIPERYPHVCNGCHKRYRDCDRLIFLYNAKQAHDLAQHRLVSSRVGLDLTVEELNRLDVLVSKGVKENNHSIYHIVKNTEEIHCSVSTVYRYIDLNILSTKTIDLPRKPALKKRKKKPNKKYDYGHSKIDRSSRTYLDYLLFQNSNPGVFPVQMDFLGKRITDTKSILTLSIPLLQVVYLYLVPKETAANVLAVFNQLEKQLGIDLFKKIFPYILTDRDTCFENFETLECSPLTGERRTRLFYCDSFTSSQKGHVENMNGQLRSFFPKKGSKEHLTQQEVGSVALIINRKRLSSLSGATPEEAFIKVYGEHAYQSLFKI